MSPKKYEQTISNTIYETLIDDLKKRNSCSCCLFLDKEKQTNMLKQIMSRQDNKLTESEALTIINETAIKIQNENKDEYPTMNASDVQIEKFVKNVSNYAARYFSSAHSNIIKLPIKEIPISIRDYLNNKTLPNIEFTIDNDNLQLNLAVTGPLVYESHNTEVIRLNNLVQAILVIGILLNFFIMYPLERKVFNLKETTFNHPENYITIESLFSPETKSLAEKLSILAPSVDDAENLLTVLNKILNNKSNTDALIYSLTWYCKSLDIADIKTIFICRYIGFEALSGIWTKTNKKDKSSQDKVKYTISALLAKDINDIEARQDSLKNIIDLRNEIFHGNKNEGNAEELERNLHKQYFYLEQIYKDLFLYTVNKI